MVITVKDHKEIRQRHLRGESRRSIAKVRELKGTLPEAFIPLSFLPGEAIQIGWGKRLYT